MKNQQQKTKDSSTKLELPLTVRKHVPACFYLLVYYPQVAIRVRPMNKAEHKSGAKIIAHTLDNQVSRYKA